MDGNDGHGALERLMKALDSERQRQGLSYAETARRAGMLDDTYRKIRNRYGSTRAITLLRLCEALDLDVCLVNTEGENIL